MKRSCNGCVANDPSGLIGCTLRYKTKIVQTANGLDVMVPDQDCPKPRTIKAYVRLKIQEPKTSPEMALPSLNTME